MNNFALFGGDDVYGASFNVSSCRNPEEKYHAGCNLTITGASSSISSISSEPTRVCLCDNGGQPRCDEFMELSIRPSVTSYPVLLKSPTQTLETQEQARSWRNFNRSVLKLFLEVFDTQTLLLMELLDESLSKMLEHSQQSLAYCVQVDICHDIALAVAYLHSNDIIH